MSTERFLSLITSHKEESGLEAASPASETATENQENPKLYVDENVIHHEAEKQEEFPRFKKIPGARLEAIPVEYWHLLRYPDYQRKPTAHKVREIAAGLRDGYQPAPITLFRRDDHFLVIDGGHRYAAFKLNHENYNYTEDIPAIIYDSIDQQRMLVLENNKLRMDSTSMIRADNRHDCCLLIEGIGSLDEMEGTPFYCRYDIGEYPVRPLTILKAGLILNAEGENLSINRLAYYSVSRAVERFENIIGSNPDFWPGVMLPFLKSIFALWGDKGRHLVNFGVLGFAYFIAKNRSKFFDESGDFRINTKRLNVSKKRRASGRTEEYESKTDSDFAKLASLKERWDKRGDQLNIEAPRDPLRVAYEINQHFWKNRKNESRVWIPKLIE